MARIDPTTGKRTYKMWEGYPEPETPAQIIFGIIWACMKGILMLLFGIGWLIPLTFALVKDLLR